MKCLSTWLKLLDERTEVDNKRTTSRWGWNLKDMHCTVAFAKKKIKIFVWNCVVEQNNGVHNSKSLLDGTAGESANARRKVKIDTQYVKQNFQWHCK